MDEMRALIGQRSVLASGIPRARPRSVVEGSLSESHSSGSEDNNVAESSELLGWVKGADELVTGAERDLTRAAGNVGQLQTEIELCFAVAKEVRFGLCMGSKNLF